MEASVDPGWEVSSKKIFKEVHAAKIQGWGHVSCMVS